MCLGAAAGGACSPPAPPASRWFWPRRLCMMRGSCRSQCSLGRAEGSLKRRRRNGDGDAAIAVPGVPSRFRPIARVSGSSWRIELVRKLGLRLPLLLSRRHRRGTMCFGLQAWAWLLSRRPRVEVHVFSPRPRSSKRIKSCTGMPPGALTHREHAGRSRVNSQIENWVFYKEGCRPVKI